VNFGIQLYLILHLSELREAPTPKMFLGGGELLKLRVRSLIFRFDAQKLIRLRRTVARSPGHESHGLHHAAPLGAGTLAARMGLAHQISNRSAPSDALLAFLRLRGS
jgi:hypothetical protein